MGENEKKVIIGSDHRGYELKGALLSFLEKKGIRYFDVGTNSNDPVDYPDFAKMVAEKISYGEFTKGILICGTGIGMSIVANKFKNIRAALCINTCMAEMSRKHNDANILVLSGRLTDKKLAEEMVKVWLETEFEGGRHKRRLDRIRKIEKDR